MSQLRAVTSSDFQKAVVEGGAVLVDFSATWCGPCQFLAPILDGLADEYRGRVEFVKVDIDDSPDLAQKFEIEGVPTLLLFRGGQPVDRVVGAAPAPALKGWLDEQLAAPAPSAPAATKGGAHASVKEITSDHWASEVAASGEPVVVDFGATWCGPCQRLAPMLDALAVEYAGKVRFVKVDIDQSPDLANKYDVEGVPTLVLFKKGEPVERVVGLAPKTRLKDWLTQHTA